MKKIKEVRLASVLIICIFLMGVPILFGLASLAQAEQFAGEIVIGDDQSLTGPYAGSTYACAEAAKDYWKQRNHRITVNGKTYKIRQLHVDNKSDVSVSVSNFHRFVQEGAIIALTTWTPGMSAMLPIAKRAKIPIVGGGMSQKLIDPPSKYMYVIQPSYPGALCAAIKWYKEKVWKGPGKMKVGILLWDSAFGRSSHKDSVYAYLKEDLGVDVLPTQFFPVRVKDFTPQLMRLKGQGVDLIFMQALAGQYAMLARDARRLQVTPKADLMSTFWCITPKFIELAGKEAAEGAYGVWHLNNSPEDDVPSNAIMPRVHDAMEKYRGTRFYDTNYVAGYSFHYLMQHMLEETIKKYGFPITGEQVADTASNLGGWDWGISRYFTGYKGGDRCGWHEVRPQQVKNGKVTIVDDWVQTPAEFLKREPWIVGKGNK